MWYTVCAIPRGQVSTYGAVARAAGLPGRARQTGYALRVAPPSLKLPWHRVVGAGGRIAFPKRGGCAPRGWRFALAVSQLQRSRTSESRREWGAFGMSVLEDVGNAFAAHYGRAPH
ncbi:MAG: cysteine methyltransferase [Gammaproteobacteria bacterium]|nr:MAG: cysteine methyltransferase [Gammaproteobacteria bacterium]